MQLILRSVHVWFLLSIAAVKTPIATKRDKTQSQHRSLNNNFTVIQANINYTSSVDSTLVAGINP